MQMYKNVLEALEWASSIFASHGREETAARILTQHIIGCSYSEVNMHLADKLSKTQIDKLEAWVQEHVAGRPVQYIVGSEEFYGRDFLVDESVLIPRPETEELVLGAIRRIDKMFTNKNEVTRLADIGTGSGAIAITMKLECPKLEVVATDLSEAALLTAKRNAEKLLADVTFRLGDLEQPIIGEKWDVILSNPPYIAFSEAVDMSDVVLEHEPHSALFAEEDGLVLYRRLAEAAPILLNVPGFIGVEIGYTQGDAVAGFFQKSFPQANVKVEKDINGKPRMVFCEVME